MIVVIMIMATFIGISGGAEAKVQLNADQDEALFQQSLGVNIQMKNLTKEPLAKNPVIVPGIV